MRKIYKYLFIIVICFSFLYIPDFYAQNCSWRSYIDVPTSTFSEGFFFNLNGSYAVGGQAQEKFDANGSIEYGIAGFVAGLKVFTEKTFCLDLAYQIIEQGAILPSFSIGVENITYNKYVAPLDTVGIVDFLYNPRPPEVASAYLVATKDFGGIFEMTFGLGRGRFVGYGPRSQYLNFDAFFDEKHPDFMVGAFGGIKYTTPIGLSFIVETDGRDANAGFRYESGIWKATLSIDKMEHFFAQREELINSPRASLSLSFNPGGSGSMGEELAKSGTLKLSLKDQGSGKSIPGKVIVSKGDIERTYEILATQKAILQLQPGVYKVSVFSAGYKMKTAEVSIKSGGELDFEIKLSQVINPAIKQSMDLTKAAASDYKKGLLKEAREKLEKAISLYPNNEKAKQGLALVRKAMAADISTMEARARALENSGDIRGAIALWEQVLSLRGTEGSSEVASHIQSLRSRLAGGGKPVVTTTTTPTVAKKPPPAVKKPSLSKQQITDLYTKGLSAYFDGNYKEAIKYFEQVLRADPSHAQAKRYLGEAKKH
jgi:tetratricopeptide (TPR) repeat protein